MKYYLVNVGHNNVLIGFLECVQVCVEVLHAEVFDIQSSNFELLALRSPTYQISLHSVHFDKINY